VALLRRGGGGAHPLVAELARRGVVAREIDDPTRGGAEAASALAARLRRGDVAVVHSHDPKANWVSRRAGGRAPRVATLHLHTRTSLALRLHALADRGLTRGFDRLIAVTGRHGLAVRDRRGRAPVAIDNGLDRRWIEAEAVAPGAAEPAASGALLVAARLSVQKGIDVLLAALPAILAEQPGARLYLAGDGPERQRLEARALSLGVAGAVTFAGDRRDLPRLLAAARALVLPSRSEGAPYAALEAMALGVPVVAAAVGGLPEILEGGAAGRLVPPEDPAALARAVIETLFGGEATAALSTRARELVDTRFSARRMAASTADLYRELVA
jgi:glycosyltransferase involved in cell wall biosynthesis